MPRHHTQENFRGSFLFNFSEHAVFKRLYTTPFVIQYNSEMFISHFYVDSQEQNGKQVRTIGRHARIIGRTMSIKE